LAYYLKLLVLLLYGFFGELFIHQNSTDFGTLAIRYDLAGVGSDLGVDALTYLTSIAPALGAMAVLLLLWPWLARFWGQVFACPSWKSGSIPAPTLASSKQRGQNTGYFSQARSLTYVLGMVILAGLCLLSYGLPNPSATSQASTSGTTSSASASSTPGASGNEGKHFKVGDHVRIEGIWIATVNSVRTDANNKIFPPMSGDTYVVVDVTLQNVSSQDQTIDSFIQFQLDGLNGKKYDDKIGVASTFPSGRMLGLGRTVPAGSADHGQVVFEVPASLHQSTLLFTSDRQYVAEPGGPHLTTWDVTV